MDRIAYTLVTIGGGEDGRDSNDLGGKVILASFDKSVIEKKKGQDTRYRIEKEIVEIDELRKEALKKLTMVERLVLNIQI